MIGERDLARNAVLIRLILVILGCIFAFGGGVTLSERLLPEDWRFSFVGESATKNEIIERLTVIEAQLNNMEQTSSKEGASSQAQLEARIRALEVALQDVLDLNLKMLEVQ